MGFFDSEKESVSSIPPYLEAFYRDKITPRLEGMVDRPYPTYGGQRSAGFDPYEDRAFQFAEDNVENPEWRPYYGRATQMLEAGAQPYDASGYDSAGYDAVGYDAAQLGPGGRYDPALLGRNGDYSKFEVGSGGYNDLMVGSPEGLSQAAIERYMSPYKGQVVDSAVRRIEDSAGKAALRDRARATRTGNLYSAGHGIIDAERDKNVSREIGDVTGRLMDEGFKGAVNQFNVETDRGLGARTGDVNRLLSARTGDAGRRLSAAGSDVGAKNRAVEFLMSQGLTREQANQQALNAERSTFAGAKNRASEFDATGRNRAAEFGATARNRASEFNRTQAMAGSKEMASQGERRQALRNQDFANLRGAGEARRGLGQRNMDLAYQDFIEQRDWPLKNLSQLSQIAAGQPYTKTQTETSSPSMFNTIAGGALTAASVLGPKGFNIFADGGTVPDLHGPRGPRGPVGPALSRPKKKPSQTPGRRGGLPPPMLNARRMGPDRFVA